MKLFNNVLACIVALSAVCTFAGSGYLVDNENVSRVYICTENKSEYKENIYIKVETNGSVVCISPTVNYGYEPSVFLGDFVGNGLSQIFYSVNSGGSGAYSSCQIISLKGGKQTTLYDSENFENTAQASLTDKTVTIKYNNRNYFLDASGADLTGEKDVVVTNVNTVMPIYNGGLKKYQIMQFQKVYIDYTANNVGYFVSIIDLSTKGTTIVNVGTLANYA